MKKLKLILHVIAAFAFTGCGGGGAGNQALGSGPSQNPAATSTTTSTVKSTTSTTLTGSGSGAAMPSLAWSVTNLGAFDDAEKSAALGINNAGQIVGFTIKEGEYYHRPFVYADGKMAPMLQPIRYESIQPSLINNNGMVAGYTYEPRARDGGGPFVYADGSYARLGSGEGAFGINDDGKSVGNLLTTMFNPETTDGSPYTYRRSAYLYSNGVMTDLTAEMGALYAYGINSLGHVVGGLADGKAYLYRNGQVSQLGTLPGDSHSLALSINANGMIVGISSTQDNIGAFSMRSGGDPAAGWRAFLYQAGVMTDLNAAGNFTISHAFAINNNGHILGEAWKDGQRFSFLYRDGKFINMNSLPELSAAGWRDIKLYGMNDAGQVVGKGTINGRERALLLTPGG